MNNMIVAIIEPDNYVRTAESMMRMRDVIVRLVVNYGANTFLFGNVGQFERDCYEFVSRLKALNDSIERHYFHGGFDYDSMIDKCDVVVTCGAALSVEYAHKKQKRVINIFEK